MESMATQRRKRKKREKRTSMSDQTGIRKSKPRRISIKSTTKFGRAAHSAAHCHNLLIVNTLNGKLDSICTHISRITHTSTHF